MFNEFGINDLKCAWKMVLNYLLKYSLDQNQTNVWICENVSVFIFSIIVGMAFDKEKLMNFNYFDQFMHSYPFHYCMSLELLPLEATRWTAIAFDKMLKSIEMVHLVSIHYLLVSMTFCYLLTRISYLWLVRLVTRFVECLKVGFLMKPLFYSMPFFYILDLMDIPFGSMHCRLCYKDLKAYHYSFDFQSCWNYLHFGY